MKSPSIIHRIKHFLEFFGKIPEEKWTQGKLARFDNQKLTMCALGHLGVEDEGKLNPEARELCELLFPIAKKSGFVNEHDLRSYYVVTSINDARERIHPLGRHPRVRILNALQQRLEMETNEITTDNSSDQALPGVLLEDSSSAVE